MSDLGNKEIMANNLNRYIAESGKERNRICLDLGIKYSTFSDWCNAKTYPRIDKIEKLANYFHIEKSDLIEHKTILKENHTIKRLAAYAKILTDRDLDIAIKISALNNDQKGAIESLLNTMATKKEQG